MDRVLRKRSRTRSKAKVTRVQIKAEGLSWDIAEDPDSGGWIGVCEDLNLNADGKTREDLEQCMGEVMSLLFFDLYIEGELEEFLKAHGWQAENSVPEPAPEPIQFEVPTEKRVKDLPDLVAATA